MSKLNNINFTEYLNDSDSDSESKIIETYSNNNEIIDVNNLSYDDCEKCEEKPIKINNKSIYNSSDDSYNKCRKDLSDNRVNISSDDSYKKCITDLSKNCIRHFTNDTTECQSDADNSEIINTEDCNYNQQCISFGSQIGSKKVNYVKEKNNDYDIRQIYLNKKIQKLEIIGSAFKKIGHSIEYYKYNLENSKGIILTENDDEAITLLNDTSLNLHNIILLEVKKNLNPSKLRYISMENVRLYEVPKIHITFNDGIIMFEIIDNKKIYNFKIGSNYKQADDLEDAVDDAIEESKYVYNYFNSRYNKISTIINYIKINSM
jgi:hypothetical protein